MWWHTRRNQIRSSSEMDESIYIGGGVSSVEYWLSWSAGRRRTIVVTLDGLFRVKLKTAGYPLHSPLSPSLLLPCVAVCHQIPFPLYVHIVLQDGFWDISFKFWTPIIRTLHLRQQGRGDQSLFFAAKMGLREKNFRKHCSTQQNTSKLLSLITLF